MAKWAIVYPDDLLILKSFLPTNFFLSYRFFLILFFKTLGLAATIKNCDIVSSHHALHEGLVWK